MTLVSGNEFDIKIGYNKRAAAKRDLTVVLQDVEGVILVDTSNAELISEIEGFVVSELTSEKATSVVLPTDPRIVSTFVTFIFGERFEVVKRVLDPPTDPFIRIYNPEKTWQVLRLGSVIQASTGPVTPQGGKEFESFTVSEIIEEGVNESNEFVVRLNLVQDPLFAVDPTDPNADREISFIKRVIRRDRIGTLKIEEQFGTTSEVSSSLLGIDRAETQLSLFSNVSTYGFNTDEFVYFPDNPGNGPSIWTTRQTESGERHYPARIEEVPNEGALRLTAYPVPYNFPYPPLSFVDDDGDGNDDNGVFNEVAWGKWQNFLKLGKGLYEYYENLANNSIGQAKTTYTNFLSRFIPAINLYDDNTNYGGRFFGNNITKYYRQISIWTTAFDKIRAGTEFLNPVTGDIINFSFLSELGASLILRGTGTDPTLQVGSVAGSPNPPFTVQNPSKETWVNSLFNPNPDDYQPGYSATGRHFALLQSRQAFRYQPGRISGYTFGTRADLEKNEGNNVAEWGIFNDFDEYVFSREGANFYLIRRSVIPYPIPLLQELGLADENGVVDTEFVTTTTKTIGSTTYPEFQEIKIPREKFNGDSLNGNGPSGYLLTTDEITMYKIEFGWYGAIGLRFYAYVPVENGEARWIVVHTFVIENKLKVPSMGDPFFKFKYLLRIGDGQGPGITKPQYLYKYGTSMYIDGGDEGTVEVYTKSTEEPKLLPSSGDSTAIFGIYPKEFITSGGTDSAGNNVALPNKKIIVPKSLSVTADGFAEINVYKCRGCKGSSFGYMPNIVAGSFGDLRKIQKLPLTDISDSITLKQINLTTSSNTTNSPTIETTDANIQYLRGGDFLLDVDPTTGTVVAGIPTGSRILNISENSGTYTITFDTNQGVDETGGDLTIPSGTELTFQPTFIVNEDDRKTYGLDVSDFEAKVVYPGGSEPRIYNTYIGQEVSGSNAQTVNIKKRDFDLELKTDRTLDPTRIISDSSTDPFTPADIFGDPDTETIDIVLSKFRTIISTPTPVSGPTSFYKFLGTQGRRVNGVVPEIEYGFTPNRPLFDPSTNELTGWVRPNGTIVQETRGGVGVNVTALPQSEYISLLYGPYNVNLSFLGLEQGEGWGARIVPFTTDFRITSPPGDNSGTCSEALVEKNNPITVENVLEVLGADLTVPYENAGSPVPNWTGVESQTELDLIKGDATNVRFLVSETPIVSSVGTPVGGQVGLFLGNGVVTTDFYPDNTGDANPAESIRFTTNQLTYKDTSGEQEITKYVIGIDGSIEESFDESGASIISPGSQFIITYTSVTMRAWFSRGSRFLGTESYTSGPNGTGIFDYRAFPLYPIIKMRDDAEMRSIELHDIDRFGNRSTFNPPWKYTFSDGNPMVSYSTGTNLQTGQLNASGVGSLRETPGPINTIVPAAFTQVTRLSSAQIDVQSDQLLRPGDNLTTIYINNETKKFDLTSFFGSDRKVITPDITNTEAVFLVGRSLSNTPVNVQVSLTYVEQL